MTVKEFWNTKEELAIHCNTLEKAKMLLKKFHELGKRWTNGCSYLVYNQWNYYGTNTCYSNNGTFCEVDYITSCKPNDCHIIEFDDLEEFKGQQEKTKQDALCCLKAMVEKENSQCARDTLEYFERLIEITDIIKKNVSIV